MHGWQSLPRPMVIGRLTPSPLPNAIHEAPPFPRENSCEKPQKLRSIHDFYEDINAINDLFCLFVDSVQLNFDVTTKDGDRQWMKR